MNNVSINNIGVEEISHQCYAKQPSLVDITMIFEHKLSAGYNSLLFAVL